MKKMILCVMSFLSLYNTSCAQGDADALAPRITREQRWLKYEENRLSNKNQWERIQEYFHEWKESFKHGFLMDTLFFKNNKITTELAQEVLEKFGRSLDNVTIIDKPMAGPACTIFNTVIIDHAKMAKLTKEEQAFILGHELVHLKNKDWVTRLLFNIFLEVILHAGLHLTVGGLNLEFEDPVTGKRTSRINGNHILAWLFFELYVLHPMRCTLSRHQEKRCDIVSAKTLGLARAGASAFEKLRKKWISRQEVPLNPNGIWYKAMTNNGWDLTHPELHDRSEYLLDLAEEQE